MVRPPPHAPRRRGREPLAADARLRQRLHGHDRRRGGQQRRPRFSRAAVADARRTLAAIIALLAVMLAGIAYLCQAYASARPSRAARLPERAVAADRRRRGPGGVLLRDGRLGPGVLALSANTGFADFPRLCRVIAVDGFLPNGFAHRGRRLVYSPGILVLAALSAGLLIVFGGITDHLIPLFAVGAFLAFTLSQAGMVAHWRNSAGRTPASRWRSTPPARPARR